MIMKHWQSLAVSQMPVITYNREIHNRTDDSVAFVVNNKERIIRRSRSYTPSPIQLDLNTEGIFAAGAELVNCFCIGKGNQAIHESAYWRFEKPGNA